VIAYDPRRFESAAAFYLQGRPAYAPALIDRVAQIRGLDGSQAVLDLGCGPGQLAIAFAPHVARVTAVDPEPRMLAIARRQARDAGVAIHPREGSSYSLDADWGPFDLVTIGRAFHWMDRPATLTLLDRIVTPGGAVALFATRHSNVAANSWLKDFEAVRDRHAEADSHRSAVRSPDWTPHEAVLLDSPFGALERISVIERRAVTLDQLIARVLSLSSSSPSRLATSAEALTEDLRATLDPHVRGGWISEVVESEALIATRLAA